MIQKVSDQGRSNVAFLEIPCPGFPITWAGCGRHDDEFCFGSEDGRLRFTTVDGDLIHETEVDQEHCEAVNGVAFGGNLIAVSSRSEIVFWDQSGAPAPVYCGGHGVISTASGYFTAPLGPNGLMKVRAIAEDGEPFKRIRSRDELLDFYKVLSLDTVDGEVLVCAVRKTGIATIECVDTTDPPLLNLIVPHELDVIDVCSLATADAPRAAAGLCRDGTLLFFNDILDATSIVQRRFDEFRGTAYRVLSAKELVIVLTSRGFYVLPELVERMRQGQRPEALPIPLEAIDVNLVGERWLLAAMPGSVRRYDVNGFVAQDHCEAPRETIPLHSNVISPNITLRPSVAAVDRVPFAA